MLFNKQWAGIKNKIRQPIRIHHSPTEMLYMSLNSLKVAAPQVSIVSSLCPEWEATEMDSVLAAGGVFKWQRRVAEQPSGAPSRGHVSLTQADLVAGSGTAEQRGQRCCFHGWVEIARGRRLFSLCLFFEGISSQSRGARSAAQPDARQEYLTMFVFLAANVQKSKVLI